MYRSIANIGVISLIIYTSFVFYGEVFGGEYSTFYVINKERNLCGEFTPGSASAQNWLPDGWQGVLKTPTTAKLFLQNPSCKENNPEYCCRENGYRYAGKPVGISSISESRAAAEFLAGRGYITSQSLFPDAYSLDTTITRKEMMKIVVNMSKIPVQTGCTNIYTDVKNDWGCKYIESALNAGILANNDTFRPDDPVSQIEALKLIFQARGIEKRYDTYSWQQDYASSAYYLGYTDEKPSIEYTPAKREWIFQTIARTFPEFKNYQY